MTVATTAESLPRRIPSAAPLQVSVVPAWFCRITGGNNLAVSASGGFTFSTALSAGAAYNVTVQTQPANQTCTVSAGSGSVAAAAVTNVQVTCVGQVAKFLYVPNALSNNVSAFSVNASTGVLTAVAGSPFATDPAPSLATADPAGKFLYVINRGTSVLPPSMSVYAINPTSGALTENVASPFELTHVAPAPSLADHLQQAHRASIRLLRLRHLAQLRSHLRRVGGLDGHAHRNSGHEHVRRARCQVLGISTPPAPISSCPSVIRRLPAAGSPPTNSMRVRACSRRSATW